MSIAKILAALSVATLAACAVGPDYETPKTSLADAFAQAGQGTTAGAADVAQFWTVFGDSTLDALVAEALAANHDLRIALASLNEARALRRLSRYDRLPTITAGGGYTRQRLSEDQVFEGTPRTTELIDAGFDAFWELDFFGRVRRNVEAANADLDTAEARLRDVQVSVVAEVARGYYELRGAQDRLRVAQDNAGNQRDTLGVTQSRLEAGGGTELDTEQAGALLSTTLSSIPAFEAQVAQGLHRLAVLTGREPGALNQNLAAAPNWPSLPELVNIGRPEDLLRRRPDIRQAEAQLAAATARIGIAVGDLFPRVTVIGNAGYAASAGSDFGGSGSETWSIGPAISWAALDLGRVRSRIDAAEARTEGALAAYEQTVLRALEETENALIGYSRIRVRHQHLRDAAGASGRAAALSRIRFDGGVADFLQVLDAERVKLEAEDRMSQSRTETATALIAVYKALGGGWQDAPPSVAKN